MHSVFVVVLHLCIDCIDYIECVMVVVCCTCMHACCNAIQHWLWCYTIILRVAMDELLVVEVATLLI